MSYFVGFGSFDTKWRHPDMPIKEGDVVFLIGWGRTSPFLAGLFTIDNAKEYAAAPVIEPGAMSPLPSLPISEYLVDPPSNDIELEGVLYAIDDQASGELLKIAQSHYGKKKLPFGKTRARGGRKQKSPDEYVNAVERIARARLGQAEFRGGLMFGYQGCCAISGCSVDAALSAAHILDYSESRCQEIWNGILLRADIHLLFDRHKLRIFPGIPPIVVLDLATQRADEYKEFHLRPMRLPKPFDPKTNQELRGRWDAANREFPHFADP